MNLKSLFKPKPTISGEEIDKGLQVLTWEGIVSMGFSNVAGGAILAAFALALGANSFQIGVLAAIPFLAQPLQIAAVVLIDRFRRRKIMAITTWLPAQLLWIPIALIPVFMEVPSAGAISALMGLMALRSILAAFTGCSWNSWVKDLVPQERLGRFFARRQALANLTGMFFGLGAALFVDFWKGHAAVGDEALGYTFAILLGALTLGLATPLFMTLIPEPLMQLPPGPRETITTTLTSPLRDHNYRHLLRFLLLWGFALNLAIPFFAVYMLERLGLSLSSVMLLSMLSLGTNILFLNVWGRLADHFGSKTVLSMSASLYMLVIFGWIFTTMPDRYFLSIPLLAIIHIFVGIAGAGVGLTTGTIGMKLAPQGQATSYLAVAGLATSIGSAIGPLAGGAFAHFFSTRSFQIDLTWIDPNRSVEFPALSLTGFDFLFGIAFVIGIMTLSLLTSLREEGEVSPEIALDTLHTPMRELARPISSVTGINYLSQFPYGYLRRVPLPGLDVALGVTSYQVADAAKKAITAATKGQETLSRVADSLGDAISDLWKDTEDTTSHGIDVARDAARGTLHAADEININTNVLVHHAIVGITQGLSTTRVDSREVFRGTGQGVVQGALEIGYDPCEAIKRAVAAAREVANQQGISEENAVLEVTRGAMQAAEASRKPELQSRINDCLSSELLEVEENDGSKE